MNNAELEAAISKLSKADIDFMLKTFPGGGEAVLRKFMSSATINKCNQLVKLGVLDKGTFPDKTQAVQYYVDSWVWQRLS